MNRALVIGLAVAFVVLAFDVSASLMMASGTCFAAWIDAIRARGQG
jgi:hypothetical protein